MKGNDNSFMNWSMNGNCFVFSNLDFEGTNETNILHLSCSFFIASFPTQANRSQINYEPLSDSQLSEIDHPVIK